MEGSQILAEHFWVNPGTGACLSSGDRFGGAVDNRLILVSSPSVRTMELTCVDRQVWLVYIWASGLTDGNGLRHYNHSTELAARLRE
jgi:hypothetical protein